jgi:uncharacterized membrane protein
MSRAFGWFLLALSIIMLVIGLTHLSTTKPFVIVFWLVVGAAAVYLLFFKRPKA